MPLVQCRLGGHAGPALPCPALTCPASAPFQHWELPAVPLAFCPLLTTRACCCATCWCAGVTILVPNNKAWLNFMWKNGRMERVGIVMGWGGQCWGGAVSAGVEWGGMGCGASRLLSA